VTEHAATAAASATAAHFAPVGEEIATAVAAAERSGMAFVMPAVVVVFEMSESVVVMVQGVEKQMAHAHGRFRYIVRVT
jgi:hypothetical protein